MGFFQDLKEDLSQAVNEIMPEEEMGGEAVAEETVQAVVEPVVEPVMPVVEPVVQPSYEEEVYEPKKESIFNTPVAVDETATITSCMIINGDISSQGSLDLVGNVTGNVNILGKLSITGNVQGNSQAAEIYAEGAKITGEVRSQGSVKIGHDTVIIGNIFATSAVIAGAVKGDIDVRGPVILDTSAIVMGNIKSKSVQINNGAVIEGLCSQCYAEVNPTSFFDEIKKNGRR